SQNQKYFSILDSEGKLKNRFVFVSNGDPKHSGLIKLGNQKVVNARLADALWYFEEDTRHPLESYVSKLDGIVFHSSLGTLADKTGRVIKLTKYICEKLNLNDQEKNRAQRCAKLCKADLATLMLGEKEFTKLQGYIGMQYALSDQEDQAVAEGIYEHYQPRGQNDALPRGLCGALVALADKMDTVCGIIGIGLMPTGSADPYALRRAANGIVQIIADRDWELDLCDLIGFSLQSFQPDVKIPGEAREKISSFFEQRVVWLLKQMDIDYDVVDSVIRKDELLIHDLIKRARVLQDVRQTPDFIKLVIGFKRASNIIAGERPQSSCDPKLMAEDAEIELYRSLHVLKENIDNLMRDFDYRSITRRLIGFGAVIDRFFDAVLVNCDDPILRRNRHALLSEVREQFLRFADISMVVIESSNGE
ncbi:MAG: glycine--tRNA ligase subunit beta, partial [Candidatus Cloacimonetes bacterium]|nr:glycine--tRNA ligase subunit beta [Candidatus Cloacimonadota bacterium]